MSRMAEKEYSYPLERRLITKLGGGQGRGVLTVKLGKWILGLEVGVGVLGWVIGVEEGGRGSRCVFLHPSPPLNPHF